jgi:3-isopropylmalate/(R)-2-methylmalate dehydratase large subunit
MNDRRTIATQGAEISADFTTFPVDDLCRAFLDERVDEPYTAVDPDPNASYFAVREVDLAALEPYIAQPGRVAHNALPVSAIEQRKVDQCFIGSCANGQLEDLRIAAEVLSGRQVAPGVRLIVTPASQSVYTDAVKAGYVEALAEAGAIVTNSTCGACFGYHMGLLGAGEVCLTASTRNFTGRMGSPDAEIYMASPRTVAAAAIAGHIIDPRELR